MEPAPTTSTSKVEFSGRSVRHQLLLAFGGTVGAFFILLVGLCAAIIFSLSELVIQESRSALTEQIVDNSKLVLGDVGLTLDAIIAQGAAALVLPLAVAVLDTSSTEVPHSLLAPDLFDDNHVDNLKGPLTSSMRYKCVKTDADLAPQRGCGDDGLQQISEQASSSYVKGFKLDGSNVAELMASHTASSCTSNPGLADLPAGRSPRIAQALSPRSPSIRCPTIRRRRRSTCSLPRRGRSRFTGSTSSSAAKMTPSASGRAPSARSIPTPTASARTAPPRAGGTPTQNRPTRSGRSQLASAGRTFWRRHRLCSRSRMSTPSGADICSRSLPPSSRRAPCP